MPTGRSTYLRGTAFAAATPTTTATDKDNDNADNQRYFMESKEQPSPIVPKNIEYKLHVNIFIIRLLGMSTRGMKLFYFQNRFHPKTGQEETVLHFLANKIHLGKVIAKSGRVYGSARKDLTIVGSR
ncbi:unnamed protein product [Onchocerca flexuosa]|uniref:KH_dom_type_1 domain-containing protein n=1 Tax=Onchocerca flexuosa TaxID=387005 RepID=A0A183HNI5_9BILA|nr:unnamed protein product [Onchocerca flexuosa]